MRIGFLRLIAIAISSLSFQLAVITPEVGWAQAAATCRAGEYVVTVSSVVPLKIKTIEDISELAGTPIVVKRESARVLLISDEPATSALVAEPTEVPMSQASSFCRRIKNKLRQKKYYNKKHRRKTVARSISCSCNGLVSGTDTPNDPYFNLQWGLHQSNGIDINAPEVWSTNRGSRDVVIAVIDSGVQYTHPDLAANMWQNPRETPGDGIDNDGNGVIDDRYGASFTGNGLNTSGNPNDGNGHGTHCAGIIGAVGNNAVGVSGVNWNVSIIGVQFLGSNGSGSYYDAIRAIDYVTKLKENGVNIVASSNSWGSVGAPWGPLGDAILRHQVAGVLFVAAAGNDSLNIETNPVTPASITADNMLVVSAIDSSGAMASFSNYGVTAVDIAAPGVQIASTYMNSGYVYLSGTSMATPMVSGAAALLAAQFPGITWSQLKQILMSSGSPLSSQSGKTVSGKMVNLSAAFNAAAQLPISQPTPSPTPTSTSVPTRTPTPAPTNTPMPTNTPVPTATPTPLPNGYWTVSGEVKASDGRGVANAFVRIVTASGTVVRQTDANGQYTTPGIFTSAVMSITVEASGYQFQAYSGSLYRNTTANFTASELFFSLKGRVISEAGMPIAGLTVTNGESWSAVTDSQGYVSLSLSHGSNYRLKALSSAPWIIDDPDRVGVVLGSVERIWVAHR